MHVTLFLCNSLRDQLFLSSLTVPVSEEYQDVPGGVQRDFWHEEERAVRGLRPLRRQGLWKGKAAWLGGAEGDGSLALVCVCVPAVPEDRTELDECAFTPTPAFVCKLWNLVKIIYK